ncbi:MAG: hypothetical protein M1823_005275 [Watsoniomyces obsoletus]|nr:MAG: hypothetical protein M1823_005275 [Watsoniomyces obsoletus]
MTTSLPEGIVTHTDSIAADIDQVDIITVEDVRRLWKVYSTNKNVLRHNSGWRLENLFWRIWADRGRLCGRLSGSMVARLFVQISEDSDQIRTTPRASPSAQYRSLQLTQAPTASPRPEDDDPSRSDSSPVSQSNRPPPILKRSRGSNGAGRVVFDVGEGEGYEEEGYDNATGVSPQSATPKNTSAGPSTSARGQQSVGGGGGRRKRTTSNRSRGVMFRRKSSQSQPHSQQQQSQSQSQSSKTPVSDDPGEIRSEHDEQEEEAEAIIGVSQSGRGSFEPTTLPPSSEQAQPRRSSLRTRSSLFPTFSSPALHSQNQPSSSSTFQSSNDQQGNRPARLAALSTRGVASKTPATLASTSTAAFGSVGLGDLPIPMSSRSASSSGTTTTTSAAGFFPTITGGIGRGIIRRSGSAVIIDQIVPLKPGGEIPSASTTTTTTTSRRSASSNLSIGGSSSRAGGRGNERTTLSISPTMTIPSASSSSRRKISSSASAASSSAIIDDDDDDDVDGGGGSDDDDEEQTMGEGPILPRTRSQLALVLERDQRRLEAQRKQQQLEQEKEKEKEGQEKDKNGKGKGKGKGKERDKGKGRG